MAALIRIKRSSVSGNPNTLGAGELAYSALPDNGSNGGDRLYIGMGTETDGNAVNHVVIGGKFFTDKLDHVPGILTASSALIVDSNSKVDQFLVDNIKLDGNTLSSSNTNGNILITPNGTGKTVISNLYIGDDSTSLLDTILSATGGTLVEGLGINLTHDPEASTTTISAELASSSNAGIASFDFTDFNVSGTGENLVTLNVERIQDIAGAMISGTGATQSGITVGYDDTNGKFTFNVNDPTITIAGDVDGSATMTNLGNTTINVTLDTVNANVGSFGSSSQVPVITVNGKGLVTAVSTANISTSFTIAGDSGTDTFNNGGTLTFVGTNPVQTAVTNDTVTISVDDATTSSKGIASFSSTNFSVSSGVVSIKSSGVSNSNLVNSSLAIGTTVVSLGGVASSLDGLTELTVDNININGNTISATNLDGNIVLAPSGIGTIDVSGKRITGLASPTSVTDAATKLYVDTVAAEGLHVQEGVDAATTDTLAILSGGTVSYDNGTLGVGATLTTTGSFTVGNPIDGVTLDLNPTMDPDAGGRVLVKNEINRAHNGIYYLINATTLRRDPLFDSDPEIEGGDFVFVVGGDINAGTGWVQTNTVDTIGTDEIIWQQFSGAGTYTAGSGMILNGTEFSVNLAESDGLEFSGSNAIQLKSSIAGNGLTYLSGVLTVGGTANRITVNSDSIDIASTYAGQSTITTVGAIGSGTWQGTVVSPTYGGTGVNNGTKTITLGGNFTHSGAHTLTLTTTGNTNVTLPTTGTLATRTGAETLSNKTITSSSFTGSVAATTLSASGLVTLTNTTDATTLGTAAVVLSGGLSVAKQIRTDSNITGNGTTSTIDGFVIDGGTY